MHIRKYLNEYQGFVKQLLTKAMVLYPCFCQCNKEIITNRLPICRLSAVASKPAYAQGVPGAFIGLKL